jgi:hypothetical protein
MFKMLLNAKEEYLTLTVLQQTGEMSYSLLHDSLSRVNSSFVFLTTREISIGGDARHMWRTHASSEKPITYGINRSTSVKTWPVWDKQ